MEKEKREGVREGGREGESYVQFLHNNYWQLTLCFLDCLPE